MNRRKAVRKPTEVSTEVTPMPDLVNHPPHYTQGGIECIQAIEAALGPEGYKAFLRGQVIKYTWRGPHKGTEALDYGKADFYLRELARVTS